MIGSKPGLDPDPIGRPHPDVDQSQPLYRRATPLLIRAERSCVSIEATLALKHFLSVQMQRDDEGSRRH